MIPLESDPKLALGVEAHTSDLPEKGQSEELALEVLAPPQVTPSSRAALSLLLPGLGQFAQGRFWVGAGQLVSVVAYSATALALSDVRALIFAIAWNVWSAIEAYRHERK